MSSTLVETEHNSIYPNDSSQITSPDDVAKESPSQMHTESQHQGTTIENSSPCVPCPNNPVACSQPDVLNIITSSSPLMAERQSHRYHRIDESRNTYRRG